MKIDNACRLNWMQETPSLITRGKDIGETRMQKTLIAKVHNVYQVDANIRKHWSNLVN